MVLENSQFKITALELLDRVGGVSQDVVDAGWCDRLAQCSEASIEKLASSMVFGVVASCTQISDLSMSLDSCIVHALPET